jgi:amylosucrase
VEDYDEVDPRVGTMADLEELAGNLRERGMALCVDLVLNHTAREHEWARKAVAGEPAYREMYLIYPDRTQPDAYERTLPEVFPDTAPGSFTEVPGLGWVWPPFHDYQWDLNHANPAIFRAMLGTMFALANHGVDVLREILPTENRSVLAYRRIHPRSAPFPLAHQLQRHRPVGRRRGHRPGGLHQPRCVRSTSGDPVIGVGRIELPAWGFAWLTGT